MAAKGKVAIIGSGLVGRSWAMVFAGGGYDVSLYDVKPEQVTSALESIATDLKDLETKGFLRGDIPAKDQITHISGMGSMAECVAGANYVQECVFESLEIKAAVFAQLDTLVEQDTILASSASAIPASKFTEKLTHRSQAVIAHPVNPTYHCPLVEVVPAPWTDKKVVDQTYTILKGVGQSPILFKKEVQGFGVNRLQYALLGECYRLIEDDVLSPEDVDTVLTEGLGMRYAFVGPLETCHLNANGFLDYCGRYGNTIYDILKGFGPPAKWEGPTLDKIRESLDKRYPPEKLEETRRWRDERLAALNKLKRGHDG